MSKLLIVVSMLLSMSVYAVDDIRAHDIDGKKFVCFEEPAALKVLKLRLEYPKLIKKSALLEEKLGIKIKEVEILESNIEVLETKVGIVVEGNVALAEKLEEKNAWWRNPTLWFGVGIITGAALAIGAVAAF